jgi:hypothetical protein
MTAPQEYQILIDSKERGIVLVTAMYQINDHDEENIPEVGLNTTRRNIVRLGPVIRKVREKKQGNRYPTSRWVKSRQRWVTQLLVMLGKHTLESTAKENEYLQLTVTPQYFDPERMTPLSLQQIVFSGECH